ncbi:MAG: ankyrin repeat domain-containing protein, partial [Candidatus Firestonebacteria bacterium]|nr:ankyrin repeat domain-containing protein [Candidatus Firestonebacteria bacterium]
MHYAIKKGHKDIVDILINKGADVNAKGKLCI